MEMEQKPIRIRNLSHLRLLIIAAILIARGDLKPEEIVDRVRANGGCLIAIIAFAVLAFIVIAIILATMNSSDSMPLSDTHHSDPIPTLKLRTVNDLASPSYESASNFRPYCTEALLPLFIYSFNRDLVFPLSHDYIAHDKSGDVGEPGYVACAAGS